ncbi:hypothetical protein [Nocardioides renjunii]|uniref:hypothetical protein n=1 Tax=Nocardioides renjunii TaxID=3095075 RepID=UPI002B0037E8|nr:hypothetical protein [Nocardioides sp. S-34]WQQ22407.1 hypothetical protein SHK17_00140 [Nocardioides sp. S-34]
MAMQMQPPVSTPSNIIEKASMARLTFGRLTEAWKGEATDFTPLLAAQLDALGDAIGVDLTSLGESEVPTTGGRRIDIVAQDDGGSEFVVENQYGRADHDHLTRGLAYAVAREARGLVVVAEQHRDEFRAVAQYLNDLAEHSPERGIAVWLVEARAVRIEESKWAPLFTAVVQPNRFTATVEQAKQLETTVKTLDEFLSQVGDDPLRDALTILETQWTAAGHRRRFGSNHMVLMAKGPSVNGLRTVVAVFNDGAVMVPFGSYAGQNSGIAVDALTTDSFRTGANGLFHFAGTEKQARTSAGWLTPENVGALLGFAQEVSTAYEQALQETS